MTAEKARYLLRELEFKIRVSSDPIVRKTLKAQHLSLKRVLKRLISDQRTAVVRRKGEKATQKRRAGLLHRLR
jgi:hypothetical protein